jgi:FlaA1/EpsC-like NDP-sugar epimerase
VPLKIVGFVDDDPLQRNVRVAGYPIVGGFSQLVEIVSRGDVDSVVLNTHLIDADRLRELEQACRPHEVALLRLHVDLKPLSAAS